MKGITPIISTIVLLLITVALAGSAWTYMSGFMGTYTEKSFTIPTGGAYCDAGGTVHVRIVNTGTTTIAATDWISSTVAYNTNSSTIAFTTTTVSPRATAEFTTADIGDPGVSYTITIGTVAGVQRIPVVCP